MKKRNDGRYEKKVYLGTENGIPKYKTVYGKTKKECDIKAAEIKVQNNKGIEILSGEQTSFNYWADLYIKKISLTAEPSWIQLQTSRLKIWCNALADTPIDKINTLQCDKAICDIAKSNPYYPKKPSSQKTVIGYRNTLSRLFDFCIQNRALTFNPAKYITLPKARKTPERKPLTTQEINAIKTVEHKLQLICLIMIYCGLRRGEATCLTWNDIQDKRIIISKAANVRYGIIKAPKTKSGIRQIPIPAPLKPYLKRGNGLVLNIDGKMFTDRDWAREWDSYKRKIKDETGINITKTIHCLRHTYCTILYNAGVDPMTAKEYMGHSNISTTMSIYTHLTEEKEKASLDKLNDYLQAM